MNRSLNRTSRVLAALGVAAIVLAGWSPAKPRLYMGPRFPAAAAATGRRLPTGIAATGHRPTQQPTTAPTSTTAERPPSAVADNITCRRCLISATPLAVGHDRPNRRIVMGGTTPTAASPSVSVAAALEPTSRPEEPSAWPATPSRSGPFYVAGTNGATTGVGNYSISGDSLLSVPSRTISSATAARRPSRNPAEPSTAATLISGAAMLTPP